MTMPLPSAAVMSNRCCHKTKLKATNKKALAINVTHSGRTALIFNMGGSAVPEKKGLGKCENLPFTATA
jgi:hypothetical protein